MLYVMKTVRILILVLVVHTGALAQDVGSWWMYWGSNKLSDRFGVWTEAQLRDYGFLNTKDQLLLRTGIEYYLKPTYTITGGYGFIKDWTEDADPDLVKTENRLWQQFNIVNNKSRLQFHHRLRLEQRWVKSAEEVSYLNRFRYRLLVLYPLNKRTMGAKTWFLAGYNEIMFGFGNDSGFDQNRLYGALGYRFSPRVELQTGYLFQTFSSRTNQRFQFAVAYNLDFRR